MGVKCAICGWYRPITDDLRTVFTIHKFVKGLKEREDRDMLYQFISAFNADNPDFVASYHKGQ